MDISTKKTSSNDTLRADKLDKSAIFGALGKAIDSWNQYVSNEQDPIETIGEDDSGAIAQLGKFGNQYIVLMDWCQDKDFMRTKYRSKDAD